METRSLLALLIFKKFFIFLQVPFLLENFHEYDLKYEAKEIRYGQLVEVAHRNMTGM